MPVAVLHSAALSRGALKGFALIFMPDALIGCKRFTESTYWARLADLDEVPRAAAAKLVADLMKDREFQVGWTELSGIEIKEPGRLKPGHMVFRTPREEHKVTVSGTFGTGSKEVLDTAAATLEGFAPGKLSR